MSSRGVGMGSRLSGSFPNFWGGEPVFPTSSVVPVIISAQVVTTRCPAALVTEVIRSRVHTSHCQTRQPVTADWKVSCQRAQVLPLLKKAGLNSSQPANYRPISNLLTRRGRPFTVAGPFGS